MPKQKKNKYYVRPDGLHEAIRMVGGKRKVFRGHTDAEVEQKMLAYKGEVEKGRLFKTVAAVWEEDARGKVTVSTWEKCYIAPYKRALEWFGDDRVTDITPRRIESAIKNFSRGKRSKQSVSVQLQVIRNILSVSVLDGELPSNPSTEVSVPAHLFKSRRELPAEDQIKIIKNAAPEGMGLFALLILYTGMRKGEALAITGDDIEEDGIQISKSVYCARDNIPRIKTPKTKAGVRTVPLLSPLKAVLPKKLSSGYLFSPDGGKSLLTEKQAYVAWKRWAADNGITITPHQLRHGYATMLFEAGLAPKDMQELLGHAQLSTSMDIYTHISDSRKKYAKTKLEEYISQEADAKNTQSDVK